MTRFGILGPLMAAGIVTAIASQPLTPQEMAHIRDPRTTGEGRRNGHGGGGKRYAMGAYKGSKAAKKASRPKKHRKGKR
jgi:hypothetical protein